MTGKMDCYGLSRSGARHAVNQDQFLIADLEKSMRIHSSSLSLDHNSRLYGSSQAKLLMVADGVGQSNSGDLASRLVTDCISRYLLNEMEWFLRCNEDTDAELYREFLTAFELCQERLEHDIQDHPERSGMETTLTLAYLTWPQLYLVHAGHSRCYLYRNSQLHQLTRDHSFAERLITSGALDVDDVPEIWQELLVNSIGGNEDSALNPEIVKTEIRVGDTLLLCTDGLTRELPDLIIAEILGKDLMADETCIRLVNQAIAQGGTDNITAVVARFLDLGDQDVSLTVSLDADTGTPEHSVDSTDKDNSQKPETNHDRVKQQDQVL
ncbi:PP2C family protein-serine/threonine phosphatase [Gimesia algae]|uniref:Serine/threonine phosphatase stp n=1 Tax=Gimesia algae TaxID=2527971 RepID=A0A517VB80_9PLAN|nr:protein phosphatase 2C domain-containing protein [Gimesia algae]QDT90239.1 Serine/threonine phosphatase stp [Gimesia algae]